MYTQKYMKKFILKNCRNLKVALWIKFILVILIFPKLCIIHFQFSAFKILSAKTLRPNKQAIDKKEN